MNAAENIEEIGNDALRWNMFIPDAPKAEVIFTPAVAALRDDDRFALLDEVRCFEDFDAGDTRRDFGALDFRGARYFWKISAGKSLAIMRAGEY